MAIPGWAKWGRPARLVFLLSVVVLVGVGDWYLRNQELGQLLDRIQASETAMLVGQDESAALTEAADVDDEEDYQKLLAEVSSVASATGEELFDARDRIESTRVMPWHFGVAKAKDRYLDHVAEWEDLLGDAARDPKTLAQGRPRIGGTFRVAVRALRQAVPMWPMENFTKRITRIEKEDKEAAN